EVSIFKLGVDNLGVKYLKQLEAIVNEEKINLIMINVGSAGSDMQQMPDFIATQSNKTAVINIDPSIELKEQKNIVQSFSFSASIDSKTYPKTYAALNDFIKNAIAADKDVLLAFYTSPINLLQFKDIILTNKDALGKNFTMISGYHEYQAVLVYNQQVTELLINENFKKIMPAIAAIFNGAAFSNNAFNNLISQYPVLSFYGKIFHDLSYVKLEDVIQNSSTASLKKIP
ncbi:MAG TPA: hypothetical protein VHM20_01635, partial [Gammaproteobacteria bacterium]|nr:hypothetical protein [Gammaproteobacteria bacterium]